MIQLTFNASVEQFDVALYKNAVKEEMRRVFTIAAQQFLLNAIPRVPIWTGMARGAFRNLEDLVGKVTNDKTAPLGVRIRTTQGRGAAGRGGGSKNTVPAGRENYFYYPPTGARIRRTPQAGRAFGTPTTKILDFTGASLAKGRTAYYFRFKIDIKYFADLDEARWQSFREGGRVMEEYVANNLNLPNLLEFTTKRTYTAK